MFDLSGMLFMSPRTLDFWRALHAATSPAISFSRLDSGKNIFFVPTQTTGTALVRAIAYSESIPKITRPKRAFCHFNASLAE
jgi:hypothetical protein